MSVLCSFQFGSRMQATFISPPETRDRPSSRVLHHATGRALSCCPGF